MMINTIFNDLAISEMYIRVSTCFPDESPLLAEAPHWCGSNPAGRARCLSPDHVWCTAFQSEIPPVTYGEIQEDY